MKTTSALLVAGVLLVGAGFGRADEKAALKSPAPQNTAAQPAPKPACAPQEPMHEYAPRSFTWIAMRWLPERCPKGDGWKECKGGWLLNWLCYQPLTSGGPCGCHHCCTPCCTPPLYTFFLGPCASGGCCAKPGCAAAAPAVKVVAASEKSVPSK